MKPKIATTALAALLCAGLAPAAGAGATAPTTTMVSRDGNGASLWCDVSSGGWAVTFMSTASNLVWRDTNGQFDVFLASEGEIERVSVTSREKQAATYSTSPTISDDGSRVAFSVSGYHLTEEGGRRRHVFVRDTTNGRTERVTVAVDGGRPDGGSTGAPQISGNGRHVAFHSHATNLTEERDRDDNADAFVRKLAPDETEKVSRALDGGPPNRWSGEPVPSQNGRFIAFVSLASDLVRGDDNRVQDVFRYDARTGQTIRVSIASDGDEAGQHSTRPSISADGRFVAFETYSSLAPEDTNGHLDVYVHDVFTGTTELISTGPAGPGNTPSQGASISADGRYVAFTSEASNLVAGDTNAAPPLTQGFDVFVRDRVEEETTLVSVGDEGEQGSRDSGGGSISPDGNYVCWNSESPDLVPGDDNGSMDVFLRGPLWAEEE